MSCESFQPSARISDDDVDSGTRSDATLIVDTHVSCLARMDVLSSVKTTMNIIIGSVQWFPRHGIGALSTEYKLRAVYGAGQHPIPLRGEVVTFLQVFYSSFAAYGFSQNRFSSRKHTVPDHVCTMAVP